MSVKGINENRLEMGHGDGAAKSRRLSFGLERDGLSTVARILTDGSPDISSMSGRQTPPAVRPRLDLNVRTMWHD
jgi:hypothetical protein